jgi:hypothetical protein
MEILGKLFGSTARLKILRLFLFNPHEALDNKEVARRARVYSYTARREIDLFRRVGLLKKKILYQKVVKKVGKRTKVKSKRIVGWLLNEKFPYLQALRNFLTGTTPLRDNDILKRLGRIGRLKLVIVAGAFTQDPNSRIDLLIVGDAIKQPVLEAAVRSIETDLGKELRYAVFNTADFQYRLNIYDRLIRDVLDYPHQKVMDRLNIDSTSPTSQ